MIQLPKFHSLFAIFALCVLSVGNAFADEFMVAKAKNGDVWIWEMPISKFDLSRLEIRRGNGKVERHVGSAPLLDGLIAASPRPSTGPNDKVPDFPLKGDYKPKSLGADKGFSMVELRCVRRCSAEEKQLLFKLDPQMKLAWTAQ